MKQARQVIEQLEEDKQIAIAEVCNSKSTFFSLFTILRCRRERAHQESAVS